MIDRPWYNVVECCWGTRERLGYSDWNTRERLVYQRLRYQEAIGVPESDCGTRALLMGYQAPLEYQSVVGNLEPGSVQGVAHWWPVSRSIG